MSAVKESINEKLETLPEFDLQQVLAFVQSSQPILLPQTTTVMTLDQRDFRLFRPNHCPYFELLP